MYPDSIYIKPALSYIIGSFPGETAAILKSSSVDSLEQFHVDELIELVVKMKSTDAYVSKIHLVPTEFTEEFNTWLDKYKIAS